MQATCVRSAGCRDRLDLEDSPQDIHYPPGAELHSRPAPAALLVTTIQVRQSQPARNSADENRFRSTQFHLQCFTHLEQSTSHR